jgi:hypothetical protein
MKIKLLPAVTRDKIFKRVKIRRDKGLGTARHQLTLLISVDWGDETLSQNFMISQKVKSELESKFQNLKSKLEFFAKGLGQN